MLWSVCHPTPQKNSHVEILTPKRDGIRRCGLWEVSHKGRALTNGINILQNRPNRAPYPLLPCVDTARSLPPRKGSSPTLISASSLQSCDKWIPPSPWDFVRVVQADVDRTHPSQSPNAKCPTQCTHVWKTSRCASRLGENALTCHARGCEDMQNVGGKRARGLNMHIADLLEFSAPVPVEEGGWRRSGWLEKGRFSRSCPWQGFESNSGSSWVQESTGDIGQSGSAFQKLAPR